MPIDSSIPPRDRAGRLRLPSGIRDNLDRGTVGDFLKTQIHPGADLAIVSAYFTIYAYQKLQIQLNQIGKLRFLFGEPRFVSAIDPDRTETKAFDIADDGLALHNHLSQKPVAKACADWIRQKVEIRSITQANLLHGKMYHITSGGHEQAILGSSNFTVRGLGLNEGDHNNIELNLIVDGSRDRADLKEWFEELWGNPRLVADVRDQVLHYLAQLYANHAPQFIYFKTLFHLFGQYLADQQRSSLLTEQHLLVDTAIWQMLFRFQQDGVKGVITKILAYNGCILADSVGLGKTYEALAVIKYFELRNERVLVLCPKKLRENWTLYRRNDTLNPLINDRFRYDVLSHTDLSRERGMSGDLDLATLNWGNYDLVVIDESHNFRNNTRGRSDETGEWITRSRYERLMEDIIRSGVKTKVLLLSATPVNNDLRDLRNQLLFLTAGDNAGFQHSLGIASLETTLGTAQRAFNEWAKDPGHDSQALMERLDGELFTLLDALTIARSRKHIHTYYADTIVALGGFPTRATPLSLTPPIDLKDRFMSYDRVNEEILRYKLALYNPSKYVLPAFAPQYTQSRVANFSQANRETYLIGMMKVNFLKRLESSVASFAATMGRTIAKIEALEERIARFTQYRADNPEIDLTEYAVPEWEDEELRAALQIGGRLTFQMAHLDVDAWRTDLHADKQQIDILLSSATQVSVERDAKLAELRKLIAARIASPTTTKDGRANRKLLVFTAFADTATYLYNALKPWAHDEQGLHMALVTGGDVENLTTLGRNEFGHILTNFSPVAKHRSQMTNMPHDEIDLLIATDCISEGQNLQDCDYLVNYDIHWNPVRIIQRFGRIDRIGSRSHVVQMVNFWPTADLDKYLALRERVEARMALVDITAAGDDNLLAQGKLEGMIATDLSYRDKQLLTLKDQVLDLEDFGEGVSLTEFTLDDFRLELLRYIEANRQVLQDAPMGLYAVVPPDPASPIIQPGTIFCLRQKADAKGTERINPLQPYFLVYIRDDGVVRFGFAQPKQILDIFRTLCAERTTPYQALCDMFDAQTQDGADMSVYSKLLEQAVAAITGSFRRRMGAQLTAGRGGVLPVQEKQVTQAGDFDLITWLVISNGGEGNSR
ncbi:MAG: helicase-related protein [Chloroflexales bacterium]